jgi:hypothetical protein
MFLGVLAVIALAVGGIQATNVMSDADQVAQREDQARVTQVVQSGQQAAPDDLVAGH